MNWNELLKYPIIVGCIFFALLGAKHWLNFDIGRATKIGATGIEFSEQQKTTSKATQALDESLKSAIARIAVLEQQAKNNPASLINDMERQRILDKPAEEVTQAVAALAKSVEKGGKSLVYDLTGYIYIGNYKEQWEKSVLRDLNGKIFDDEPNSVVVGDQYTVRGNMVIRENEPKNDSKYYRGSPSLGTITAGTEIIIEAPPRGIDRKFAVQYWVKVRVLE